MLRPTTKTRDRSSLRSQSTTTKRTPRSRSCSPTSPAPCSWRRRTRTPPRRPVQRSQPRARDGTTARKRAKAHEASETSALPRRPSRPVLAGQTTFTDRARARYDRRRRHAPTFPRAPRRAVERRLDVHQAALGGDARGPHARRRRAHVPRRRGRTDRPRTRERRARPRRDQRQLEDGGARVRDRRRLPGAREQGGARRHPRDGASRRGARPRRRRRERRGRVALARRRRATRAPASSVGRGRSSRARSTSTTTGSPLVGLPLPRRDLFNSIRYVPFDVVQTTRGCPFPCEFCSVSTYNGNKFRFRPVRRGHRRARDVRAAHPLRRRQRDDSHRSTATSSSRRWCRSASTGWRRRRSRRCTSVDNIEVMARAGCRALFIGFESVADGAVRGAGKKQNKPQQVHARSCGCLADHGIAVWGSFIFGLDDDSADAFERTVEFCVESKVTMALFALLTPYPGTALYKRLQRRGTPDEGRVVAQHGPRHRRALLQAGAHVARGAARRAGCGRGDRCTRWARSAGDTTSACGTRGSRTSRTGRST